MVRFSACVVLLLSLSGCITGQAFTCPDLKQYSPDKMQRVAGQLRQHRASIPDVADLVSDYGGLRKGLRRACPVR